MYIEARVKTALKLETALIYTLHDVLVNYNIAFKDNENDDHFLAHFAIESTTFKQFPLHNMILYGHYGTDNTGPNKLVIKETVFMNMKLDAMPFLMANLLTP